MQVKDGFHLLRTAGALPVGLQGSVLQARKAMGDASRSLASLASLASPGPPPCLLGETRPVMDVPSRASLPAWTLPDSRSRGRAIGGGGRGRAAAPMPSPVLVPAGRLAQQPTHLHYPTLAHLLRSGPGGGGAGIRACASPPGLQLPDDGSVEGEKVIHPRFPPPGRQCRGPHPARDTKAKRAPLNSTPSLLLAPPRGATRAGGVGETGKRRSTRPQQTLIITGLSLPRPEHTSRQDTNLGPVTTRGPSFLPPVPAVTPSPPGAETSQRAVHATPASLVSRRIPSATGRK